MNDDTAVGAGSPRPPPIYRPAHLYPGEFFKPHKEYLVYQEPLREKTAMSNFIERLYTSDEPAVRYKTRVYLFDENPATPDAQELQNAIKMSNGCSPVDWGGTSTKHMNPFVTVEALSVCKRATVGR